MKKEDIKIGKLIKELRKTKGISQMKLAEMVGVSYQQIQKYEKSVSRISVERLKEISKALGVPMNLFFQPERFGVSEPHALYKGMTDEEELLLQLFRKIKDKKLKRAVLTFLEELTQSH